jgi:outer membrane receptor for Fe3+-dicitrate
LIALHAIAEEAVIDLAEPKGAMQKVQRVEVRGVKDVDDMRESTAAKTVILGADIVRYGNTSLADFLKRLPGISVRGVRAASITDTTLWVFIIGRINWVIAVADLWAVFCFEFDDLFYLWF